MSDEWAYWYDLGDGLWHVGENNWPRPNLSIESYPFKQEAADRCSYLNGVIE